MFLVIVILHIKPLIKLPTYQSLDIDINLPDVSMKLGYQGAFKLILKRKHLTSVVRFSLMKLGLCLLKKKSDMLVALYGDSFMLCIRILPQNFQHEAQNLNIKCFPDGHWHYQRACTFKPLEPRNT